METAIKTGLKSCVTSWETLYTAAHLCKSPGDCFMKIRNTSPCTFMYMVPGTDNQYHGGVPHHVNFLAA